MLYTLYEFTRITHCMHIVYYLHCYSDKRNSTLNRIKEHIS